MRTLKAMLATSVALGLAFVVGGLMLPSTSRVERDIRVDRPLPEVFAVVDSFERFTEWSPWTAADPDAVYTYSGPAQGKGASMGWTGNAAMGSGSQRIVDSRPHGLVVTQIDFGGSQATGTFSLSAEGGGTRLHWTIASDHGYNPLQRWFGVLLLDRMIGPDVERGLSNLKSLLEDRPPGE